MMLFAIIVFVLVCVTLLLLAMPFSWVSNRSFGAIWAATGLSMLLAFGIYLAGWLLAPHCAPDLVQRFMDRTYLLEACRSDDAIGVAMLQLPALALAFSTVIVTALATHRRSKLFKTPKGAN